MMTLRIGGKLHLAPLLPTIQDVLDLGTGTGIWAIQMGDEYESAQILGNDLSPTQPSFIPPNVRFEVDDIEEEWTYSKKFDFIHARYLMGAIKDWPKMIEKCFKYLKPGGWIELQDFNMQVYSMDGSLKKDSYLTRYLEETLAGMISLGVEPEPGPKMAEWKQVGLLNLANFADGLEGFSMRLLTGLRGWKKEEVEVHMAHVKKELKTRSIHPQHDMFIVYAQKPEDAE
ncbi:putative methyltransferase domain-containing protein [Neofusicoccum parvum UCRNP2]|uniref:Putative methyltransferase domain-containing protein n=1 Tax=Botryosphaeria parva (strain UCR-NP2) TaxID=1287680 RepID=R1EGG3_BOTPV|nr:putative methyltransferase domain-containing protein [Neofusicoccum parvum UCRNP2]